MTPRTTQARSRFIELLRRDILEIDAADLDFGIYRVLNHRRATVERFLGEELPAEIEAALAHLPGSADEDEQARIYNALFTFFARYYDEGDFMPRARRGNAGGAAYSVPYDGSDTFFHWATKGSHYVKSGERFASYAYRQSDGTRVRLVMLAASVERDNTKGAQRFDLPTRIDAPQPAHAGEWRVGFGHRALTDEEARRYGAAKGRRPAAAEPADADADASDATEGKGVQERIVNAWLAGATLPPAIDRAALGGHMHRYVKGRSADFFVHPQLGAFLRGELDHFLKSEFLNLWDLPAEALGRERGKLAICREIGRTIIAVLAALEDLQARLFEKRKFVLQAHYLVQSSWLAAQGAAGAALVARAAAHAPQVARWQQWLCAEAEAPAPDGPALLARCPHLPLDTLLFADDEGFVWDLLACVPDLPAATGGVLVHGDNYAALRTLEPLYREAVKCIYIDPPYNTDAGPIDYKNGYRSATWVSLLDGRLRASKCYLPASGVFCATIDDYQVHELANLLNASFSPENQLGTAVIRINPSGRSTVRGFSVCHEYAFFYGKSDETTLDRLPRTEQQLERFSIEDGVHVDWRNFRKDGGAVTYRSARPKQFYPIYVNVAARKLRLPPLQWKNDSKTWLVTEPPLETETAVFPIDDKGRERVWSLTHVTAATELANLEVRVAKSGEVTVMRRHTPNDGVLPRSWWEKNTYAAREHGSAAISALFGDGSGFSFAKAPQAVADCIWIGGLSEDSDSTVLDYFAGSGTTAHAVINLNREDGGARRFILVEQGEYFDTVTLPRVAKVMACPEWKDGKPKPGLQHDAQATEDPQAHWSQRTLPIVQVLRIERYEDSLDALALPTAAAAAGQAELAGFDALLRYVADIPGGQDGGPDAAPVNPVRLSTAALSRPLDYRLPTVWDGHAVERPVDLLHTALLLLGLHAVRVRRLPRPAAAGGGLALLAEVRPHRPGQPAQSVTLELLLLREHDLDALSPAQQAQQMQAECDWLGAAVLQHFGRTVSAYACVHHNRDLLLLGEGERGASIDTALAQAMWARDPAFAAR